MIALVNLRAITKMHKLKTVFWLTLLSQLILIGFYPLMDTTEARYADIARRMLALNDWITPWFDDNQPFWGKPPLSFWVTMFGFKLFGINEFGARFFYWVVSLLVLAITYLTASAHSKRLALYALPILVSFMLFYLSSVAVMTDMVLVLGGAIAMYSQYQVALKSGSKTNHSIYLAIGLSIGLLAKGPIALILFLTPFVLWLVATRQLSVLYKRYHLLLIFSLTLLISLPWYWLAEQKTPGFLNYFILGEHWQRFTVAGWEGDLYGSAHDFPRGTIWMFLITATIPWCFLVPYLLYQNGRAMLTSAFDSTLPGKSLLLAWAFTPLVFFTFSGNVLWTYLLPGLPALAIIFSHILMQSFRHRFITNLLQVAMALVVVIKLIYLITLSTGASIEFKTTKYLIESFESMNVPLESVYFVHRVPFSAKFYSHGRVNRIQDIADIPEGDNKTRYVIIKTSDLPRYPQFNIKKQPVRTYGKYQVFSI